MSIAYSCTLLFLETTFIYAGLLILHGLRKVTGAAGFYLALGMLFVFMQLAGAAGFRIDTGLPGLNFDLMSTGMMLPILAALMVIYISDGTLEAQRVIIGMMAALGLYVYLAKLTGISELAVNGTGEVSVFGGLIYQSVRAMAATVISFAWDIFLIPIFYQGLRNMKCRLFIAVMGALLLVQLCDGIIYTLILNLGKPQWWLPLQESYLAKIVTALWLSAMSSFYLARIPKENPGTGRSTLDIIIAFFGNYGKAKVLEENLKRSEERYKLLFEHAGDMVLTIHEDGTIHNVNQAASRLTGLEQLQNRHADFSALTGIKPEEWRSCTAMKQIMPLTGRTAELTFTPFQPVGEDGPTEYIVFGRDVTERTKLEKELEELHVRTEHNQRLQSIGRLAGGIAHDFNNFLHAIQGHLDLIRYMYPAENEDVNRHLEKIDSITEKASLLTRQMLGFARKGDYEKSIQNPAQLIRATLEMFPGNAIQMEYSIPAEPDFRIEADAVQIQQAILNILINARDAMNQIPEWDRHLKISLFSAASSGFIPDPPDEAEFDPEKLRQYCVIRIADSGPGIPDEIRHRILEPFFTTKPVGKGTGMGLSMAYGAMLSHKGWLQCRNASDGGAVFELIFPLA